MPANDSEQVNNSGSGKRLGRHSVIGLAAASTAMTASKLTSIGEIINAEQRIPSLGIPGAKVMDKAADCVHLSRGAIRIGAVLPKDNWKATKMAGISVDTVSPPRTWSVGQALFR